jgi:hypothetical protein
MRPRQPRIDELVAKVVPVRDSIDVVLQGEHFENSDEDSGTDPQVAGLESADRRPRHEGAGRHLRLAHAAPQARCLQALTEGLGLSL